MLYHSGSVGGVGVLWLLVLHQLAGACLWWLCFFVQVFLWHCWYFMVSGSAAVLASGPCVLL